MSHFNKKILDHFRAHLTTHHGWEIQNIYDDMDDRMKGAIAPGMESKLFQDLIPAVVDWMNACLANADAQVLTVIEYMMHLIETEKLSELSPFVVRAINNNKKNVIRNLLEEADAAITSPLMGNDHKQYLIKMLNELDKLHIEWPELEVIRRGIT